jgi:hypothetical protein
MSEKFQEAGAFAAHPAMLKIVTFLAHRKIVIGDEY